MNDQTAAQAAQAQYEQLLTRSATDAAFRHRLLTDTKATMSEFLGHEITDDVRVVESTAATTFVLPPFIDENAELSDRELEAVAGGSELVAACIAVVAGGVWLGSVIAKELNEPDKTTSCTAQ